MNVDSHFHYFPKDHAEHEKLVEWVDPSSIMLIHGSQIKMPGFIDGMEKFRGKFQLAIELSVNNQVGKIERTIRELKYQNYEVIISIHTYKSPQHFLQILETLVPVFPMVHHLGHPFHKEKTELDPDVIHWFIEFCSNNNLAVELNERYSRLYNVQLYNRMKEIKHYYATDAHVPKDVCKYRKLTKYSIISVSYTHLTLPTN